MIPYPLHVVFFFLQLPRAETDTAAVPSGRRDHRLLSPLQGADPEHVDGVQEPQTDVLCAPHSGQRVLGPGTD